ncbi:unnamed protein product [Leptidea sinapis]|uniref:Catalase core domain-containing protein n=1 Tax=Leptidea sinapis TaxID=189913 RepID=A0A5E4QGA6_9NEOP|nr:unnamed protein product [Leptidea sinapis]
MNKRVEYLFFILSVILHVKCDQNTKLDPVRDQLELYRQNVKGKQNFTTLFNGSPVDARDKITLNNDNLFDNRFFVEAITHINRQNIPERIVHGRGAGAFGYFEVTNSIANVCRADFLDTVGKKTPVAVRFSLTTYGGEGSDTAARVPRGFAIKFYTETGNFDIPGLNTPIFVLNDPIKFIPFRRTQFRNPATNIRDSNMVWDYITTNPESISVFLIILGDSGIPKGYRHMEGFGIHTYQVHNKKGEVFFLKWILTPDAGVASLTDEEANKLNAADPDSFTRDLYEAIGCGKKVSWTVSVQILTKEDVKKAKIDVFDITVRLPTKLYPLVPVGKLVLNKNPLNYFSEIEQLAFCPGNLVRGIDGGVDKVFQARKFSYRDAQMYRLGVNFNNINVNAPDFDHSTYFRDGRAPTLNTGNDSPNYFENSFNGTIWDYEPKRPKLYKVKDKKPNNTAQATEIYNEMSKAEQGRLVTNIVNSLSLAETFIQNKAVKLFTEVDPDLGKSVSNELNKIEKKSSCDGLFSDSK